jgi:hypothetical protein
MDALIPNLLSTPIWGDVYSIVLTIKRKALSRGN